MTLTLTHDLDPKINKVKVITKNHAKPQGDRSYGSGLRLKKLFIGVLMKKEKEKKKDNQYKLNAIGLIS